VFAHRAEVIVLDVRESAEISASPIGGIPESQMLPLSGLRGRLDQVPCEAPIVVVCPTGARSAMAATILEHAGVTRVANLRGGLLEWMALGFPLVANAG
jgi:rhodanese-related sulfurtransferase